MVSKQGLEAGEVWRLWLSVEALCDPGPYSGTQGIVFVLERKCSKSLAFTVPDCADPWPLKL